jgi:hypothetical protein
MKTQTFFLALALATAGSTPATHAQTTFLPQSETDAIVLKFQATYADTFDRRDAKGMAALLTENATLQNEWGDVVQGRTNIEATLTRLMANLPAGAKTRGHTACFPRGRCGCDRQPGHLAKDQPEYRARANVFHTGWYVRADQWRLAATQIARPSAIPKPTSQPK